MQPGKLPITELSRYNPYKINSYDKIQPTVLPKVSYVIVTVIWRKHQRTHLNTRIKKIVK